MRGTKGYGLLGGVQTPTVIKSAEISPNSTFEGIFHITDWFSTIAEFAGYSVPPEEDSINQYEALKEPIY